MQCVTCFRAAAQWFRVDAVPTRMLTSPGPVPAPRLVRRCLEKDPEDRWQSMRDIVLELRAPAVESQAARPMRWRP
mgnify:CR=1 FL=1